MVKLVQKISSLVAKTGEMLHLRESSMNENSARKIQKNAFEKSMRASSADCSPTYFQIAAQLNNKQDQVFTGAVYHLVKIAKSSKRYQAVITEILNKHAQSPDLSAYRKKYLAEKLAELDK